jgi:hypothetical protein
VTLQNILSITIRNITTNLTVEYLGIVVFCPERLLVDEGVCSREVRHRGCVQLSILKRLSLEIFGPVFWAVWIYLCLNVNRLWFFNFNGAPLILDTYSKF